MVYRMFKVEPIQTVALEEGSEGLAMWVLKIKQSRRGNSQIVQML